MKVVIVGGGAGGISTASNLRRLDKNVEIIVLTRDNHVSYSPCAIPYVLSDNIHSFDDIVMRTVDDYKAKNIDVLIETEVTAVDSAKKTITYSTKGESEKTMSYDKLVLATGGSPFVPPMKGVDLDGVFKIRTLDDGKRVKEWSQNCKSALVTGAGLIGIEIAYAFKKMGLKVTLCEMLPQIVPRSLDPDMAGIITDYLIEEGIDVVLGQPITELKGEDGKVKTAVFEDGSEADADMVILATGVRAELDLAKMAGCDCGRCDCVESYSAILRSNTVSQLGTTAVRQAKTLAQTLAGKRSRFNPVLNSMVTKVGNLEFGAVGLTRSFAQQNSIKAVVAKVEALTRARYYPNAKPMNVKVICDADGTIIGCQIIAEERVAERIDTMTLAITEELTCFELSNMEFAYAPPVSMVIDPLVMAVEEVSKKFDN